MKSTILSTTEKVKIKAKVKRMLADTYTPVSLYLKLRDHFGTSVLLESTDFRSTENCFSFIGLQPIATIKVQKGIISTKLGDESEVTTKVTTGNQVVEALNDYITNFDVENLSDYQGINGFFWAHWI